MSELQSVSDADFDTEVLQAAEPVLVDFWAPWCPNCISLKPVLEQIAVEENLRIVTLNIEPNRDTMTRYRVASLPTMILFHKGNQIKKMIGAIPKQELQRKIHSVLK